VTIRQCCQGTLALASAQNGTRCICLGCQRFYERENGKWIDRTKTLQASWLLGKAMEVSKL